MKTITMYMVYHQSADSWNSHPELPVKVFSDEERAIEFAKAQDGYGYKTDWFVTPIEGEVS